LHNGRVSIVMMSLNEVEGLKKVVPRINRAWADEIILVDGGSTDGTLEEARKQGIRVVGQEIRGRGEAYRVGLRNTTGDIVVYFSPDGNERPEDIPNLVAEIRKGNDMVIASRFLWNSKSYDATPIRRFGNHMFTFLVNLLFRTKVTDCINGLRAITRECMEDIDTRYRDFQIEMEMTVRAAKKGYHIGEIPTIEGVRVGGKGKLKTWRDGWRYTLCLLKELFIRR